ncbi:MAG TPA: peptide ABC transporter substrate-binding protein, partial [Waddliaceae bacterium]
NGTAELSAAQKVEVSDDRKTYLFSLRKLQWSNGEELTAYQFEKNWKKSIKSPSCLRPDMFYLIQNARKARFDQVGVEEIGVKALDRRTLKVTLEYAAPYFLELLAHPLFFPICEDSGEPYIFSGPFTLHTWNRDVSLTLIKNPYYWDFENVKLEGIEISMIRDPSLAFQKYEQGTIDWIGGPFSLFPLPTATRVNDELQRVDTPGVAWLYCNLAHPLFSSAKIRRALAYSLDRKKICEKTILNPIPLKTQLPTMLSQLDEHEVYPPQEEQIALELFEQGLEEIKCSRNTLANLSLFHSHITGQKELAIEVQRQWQQAFGIKIECIEKSWNTFSQQLDNRLMHFGSCYRHPFYYDPMYFFQIFNDSTNIHNAFGWHSESFNHLIDQARIFPNDKAYLKLAETELLQEMPVIPIHMVTYHYLARSNVQGIHFCHSGDVDFRWIYLTGL